MAADGLTPPLAFLSDADRIRLEQRTLVFQLTLVATLVVGALAGWLDPVKGPYGPLAIGLVAFVQVPVAWYVLTRRLRGENHVVLEVLIPFTGVASITFAWTAMSDQTHLIWVTYLLALLAYSRRLDGAAWSALVGWTFLNVGAAFVVFGARGADGAVAALAPEIIFFTVATAALSTMISRAWRQAEGLARWHATRDQLTGLANRRWLSAELAVLSRDPRATYSVLMIDLDNFKRLNDERGHAAGDKALAAVARILSAELRSEDLLGRYGGEEFLVLLPGKVAADGAAAAERLRSVVAAEGPVSVSIGVAERLIGESSDHLIRRADMELLRAKREGKDRVRVARQPGRRAAA